MALGSLLVGATLVFYIQYHLSRKTLTGLQTHWVSLQKDVLRVSQLQTGLENGGRKEKDFLEHYVVSPLPLTIILNSINKFLPDSVWVIELKISREPQGSTFLLKGLSLPADGRSSIQDIEKYLRDIKEKFPEGTEVVLTTSRQTKEGKELTLFSAIFKWS